MLASVGSGASLPRMSSSSLMPAPVRADTKHTGTRWPSRRACSKGAWSCSGSSDSPCSRYFAIRSSSSSTIWSTMASCAADTLEKAVAAALSGAKKQSMTRLPSGEGRFSGRHSRPKVAAMASISAVRSVAASILLITIIRHLPFAASIMRRVPLSMPAAALMTTAAVSTAGSAMTARPERSGRPGVSSRLIQCPAHSRCTSAACSEWPMAFSCGSKSATVSPRSTLPAAPISPAAASRASTRVVLPLPAWPSRARLRMS